MKRKTRVLLVDDDISAIQPLLCILTNHGCEVTIVFHGADAIQMINQKRFDLFIVDWLMPHIGGSMVLRALQRRYEVGLASFHISHGEPLPALIHTGLKADDPRLLQTIREIDILGTLEKTLPMPALTRAVSEALESIKSA